MQGTAHGKMGQQLLAAIFLVSTIGVPGILWAADAAPRSAYIDLSSISENAYPAAVCYLASVGQLINFAATPTAWSITAWKTVEPSETAAITLE